MHFLDVIKSKKKKKDIWLDLDFSLSYWSSVWLLNTSIDIKNNMLMLPIAKKKNCSNSHIKTFNHKPPKTKRNVQNLCLKMKHHKLKMGPIKWMKRWVAKRWLKNIKPWPYWKCPFPIVLIKTSYFFFSRIDYYSKRRHTVTQNHSGTTTNSNLNAIASIKMQWQPLKDL